MADAAAGAIGVAVAITAITGGESSEPARAVMAVFVVSGLASALTRLGQLLAPAHRSQP